ncbi:MAG: Coq4 family protein [Synechococcaceae cyanobacterium]|nr:Coq4 family protein [Synechococcaceae cyanobacterium]
MGFRYLNQIATQEHLKEFLDLTDLALGAADSASNVFLLSHRLRDSAPMRLCERILRRDPASAALIDERRPVGPYDAEALLRLPKGSLGHTFATVLGVMGYDIGFYPEGAFYNDLQSDADYINYRVFATHDIHHILTGFSLDNFGETGVISLSVGQFNHPGLAFTDLIGLLLSWLTSDTPLDELDSAEKISRNAGHMFEMINRGIAMGAAARPLFPVLWEERMGQDLEELRQELGIEALRQGPCSWMSDARIQAALHA